MKFITITLTFLALLCNQNANAFTISSADGVQAADVYEYYFSETAIVPDYTVKVSETTIVPDLTLQIVHDPEHADLIFVDKYAKADMFVKKAISAIGVKTIKVSETAIVPDISVKLSETAVIPDFTIYVLSSRFTKEEAAALFAVIWKAAKDAEQ
jgi:hypothetical protein